MNPAISPVWGAIFYGERVAPLAVLGLALALGANVLLLVILHSTRPVLEPATLDSVPAA